MQVTSTVEAAGDTVTATGITQFSGWTLADNIVLSAGVEVSRQVFDASGNPVKNAVGPLADSGGNSRLVRTSSFGYYRFEDVPTGETYVIPVRSKGFIFAPQVVSVTESITDLSSTARYLNSLKDKG